MMPSSNGNNSHNPVEQYMSMLGDELVRETSLPDDKYHLGKMILKVFKKYPNRIMQIDAQTGESENIQSFHDRTVRTALAMRARGLHTGDVVGVLGPNHLDLAVPFIACCYDGLIAWPLDRTWRYGDFDTSFQIIRPKMIFCQSVRANDIQKVIKTNDINCEIITFDDNNMGYETIREFLQSVKDVNEMNNFKPADFDTSDTTAVILSTSGSTGPSKSASITHKALVHEMDLLILTLRDMGEDRSCLLLPSLQWATGAMIQLGSCLFPFTRIQTSADQFIIKQFMEIIHEFKPKWSTLLPSLARMLLQHPERTKFDFTSLQVILIGGNDMTVDLIKDLEQLTKGRVYNGYGTTETGGLSFNIFDHSIGSCGSPAPGFEYKIVNVESGIENGPNVPGELWIKGPTLFKGYYGKPEATREVLSEDGYYKTGDLFYKDENDNYIFVDRMKMIIKYKTYQISPVEIETIISQHPGVKEVGVTGVVHHSYGELPTACIVRTAPGSVTEDEIHKLVKKHLEPAKYLRGGVLFVDKLMLTSNYKIDRRQLRIYAENSVDLSTLKIVE